MSLGGGNRRLIDHVESSLSPLSNYQKEERPWGNFERFTLNERTTVKIVTVSPREAISLQIHGHRDEFWRILSGGGEIMIGETHAEAEPGRQFFSRRGEMHRVEAGPSGLSFLEIAFGDFDEGDITRLEDRYGRD